MKSFGNSLFDTPKIKNVVVWLAATVAANKCEGRHHIYDGDQSIPIRNGNAQSHDKRPRRLTTHSSFPMDPNTTELKQQNENEIQRMQQVVAEAIGGAFFDGVEPSFIISSDLKYSENQKADQEDIDNGVDTNFISNEDDVQSSPAIGHTEFRGEEMAQLCKDYFRSAQIVAHSKPVSSYAELYMGETTMFTTLPEGDLILWNALPQSQHSQDDGEQTRVIMQISAYNSMMTMDEKDDTVSGDFTWQYISPKSVSEKHGEIHSITQTTVLDGHRQEYVALPLWGGSNHFWYDYIGMIAYLKQKLPTTAKYLLVDDTSGYNKRNLEALDADFARERVLWIVCPSNDPVCNQRIQVRGGGTLTVVKPPVSMRHLSFAKSIREWIKEQFPGDDPNGSVVHKKVIYFMQEQLSDEGNGTAIKMIQKLVSERMPDHSVVVLHPQHFATVQDVMKLMSTASIVIGATSSLPSVSSDFAPLFLKTTAEELSSGMSSTKPKVLEFLFPTINEEGSTSLTTSLYEAFSAMPWAEYHYIVANKMDFRELDQALESIIVSSA